MLSGKQREILQREELFLEVAQRLFREKGPGDVAIGRIAEETGFSKGSVYQRFATKDELLVELGRRCRARMLATMERGAAIEGRPRERLLGVGEAVRCYVETHPNDLDVLGFTNAQILIGGAPEEQQHRLRDYDVKIFDLVRGTVVDAIEQGDLVLDEGTTPDSVCFAFWALFDGCMFAMTGSAPVEETGIGDPLVEAYKAGAKLMDGYGWRPLSHEWDYEETRRRVREAILVEPLEEAAR
ncbi:MAG: TetR/AcrR family transcriptional regulator [bacterium]|nr:TetR/AcrR family transcriptional regulator [bacterium]